MRPVYEVFSVGIYYAIKLINTCYIITNRSDSLVQISILWQVREACTLCVCLKIFPSVILMDSGVLSVVTGVTYSSK